MIAPELLARFPHGTSAEDAAAFMRSTGGNLAAAVEMCRAGHQVPSTSADQQAAAARRPIQSSSTSSQAPQRSQRTPGTNNYFVGGGDSSGQAVIAPPAPNNRAGQRTAAAQSGENNFTEDSIENVFAKARENGARQGAANERGGGGDQAFAGSGRRLGHLEGPSPVMQATRRLQRTISITFFENGFQIEDGPLRSFTDDAGARFLESINKGYIPRELVADYGDVDINVNLVDRREEQYTPPPPPAYTAFGGSGRSLGATAASASATVAPPVPDVTKAQGSNTFSVDASEETCKIMFMNLAGVRSEHTVNPTRHTVRDLRIIASNLQGVPQLPLHSFQLMVRDVPPRTLSDDTATIEAVKCKNATIMMKKL